MGNLSGPRSAPGDTIKATPMKATLPAIPKTVNALNTALTQKSVLPTTSSQKPVTSTSSGGGASNVSTNGQENRNEIARKSAALAASRAKDAVIKKSNEPINPLKNSPTPLAKSHMGDLSGPKMPPEKKIIAKPAPAAIKNEPIQANKYSATPRARADMGDTTGPKMPTVKPVQKPVVSQDTKFKAAQNAAATPSLGKGPDAAIRDKTHGVAVTSKMTDARTIANRSKEGANDKASQRGAPIKADPIKAPAIKANPVKTASVDNTQAIAKANASQNATSRNQLGQKLSKIDSRAKAGKISKFGQAFASARAKGASEFEFNGKKYTTNVKGEKKNPFKESVDTIDEARMKDTPSVFGKSHLSGKGAQIRQQIRNKVSNQSLHKRYTAEGEKSIGNTDTNTSGETIDVDPKKKEQTVSIK